MVGKQLPEYILQEVQGLVAVVCRNMVMTGGRSSEGETTSGQELLMEKAFHGSEGYSSHLDLLLQGKGIFEMAFVKSAVQNNLAGNEQNAALGYMLELRAQLHCDISKCNVVASFRHFYRSQCTHCPQVLVTL
jgi:hypothetical protein